MIAGVLKGLKDDADSIGWLCGYMASEINTQTDNHRQDLLITTISQLLVKAGWQPFTDFVPLPGNRLLVCDQNLVKFLPPKIRAVLENFASISARGREEVGKIIDALKSEWLL